MGQMNSMGRVQSVPMSLLGARISDQGPIPLLSVPTHWDRAPGPHVLGQNLQCRVQPVHSWPCSVHPPNMTQPMGSAMDWMTVLGLDLAQAEVEHP